MWSSYGFAKEYMFFQSNTDISLKKMELTVWSIINLITHPILTD